jgi:peptidoglycan/xylan/chitin deacetylase (PgdA/CDA1 family)
MRIFLPLVWLAGLVAPVQALEPIPDRLVVLTFDDSAKSHFTVVRPLLKRLGFGATFFITEGFDFRGNKRDYMTWEEIAQLHQDGFEIGNHTLDHRTVTKDTLRDLAGQVRGINTRCREYGIPAPTSFAYPGNGIDVGALPVLRDLGIQFARRGGLPEYPYKDGRGFAFEPGRDHPLLIPSAGDARPGWTLKDFQQAVEQARDGHIAVLQFHGVPDTAHDWVNTPAARFEAYMSHLAEHRYKVIALRDLARYVDPKGGPKDPLAVIVERSAHRADTATPCYATQPGLWCRSPFVPLGP